MPQIYNIQRDTSNAQNELNSQNISSQAISNIITIRNKRKENVTNAIEKMKLELASNPTKYADSEVEMDAYGGTNMNEAMQNAMALEESQLGRNGTNIKRTIMDQNNYDKQMALSQQVTTPDPNVQNAINHISSMISGSNPISSIVGTGSGADSGTGTPPTNFANYGVLGTAGSNAGSEVLANAGSNASRANNVASVVQQITGQGVQPLSKSESQKSNINVSASTERGEMDAKPLYHANEQKKDAIIDENPWNYDSLMRNSNIQDALNVGSGQGSQATNAFKDRATYRKDFIKDVMETKAKDIDNTYDVGGDYKVKGGKSNVTYSQGVAQSTNIHNGNRSAIPQNNYTVFLSGNRDATILQRNGVYSEFNFSNDFDGQNRGTYFNHSRFDSETGTPQKVINDTLSNAIRRYGSIKIGNQTLLPSTNWLTDEKNIADVLKGKDKNIKIELKNGTYFQDGRLYGKLSFNEAQELGLGEIDLTNNNASRKNAYISREAMYNNLAQRNIDNLISSDVQMPDGVSRANARITADKKYMRALVGGRIKYYYNNNGKYEET